MTDKKYEELLKKHEELLKCAEDLISGIYNCQAYATRASNIQKWSEYQALKACLPPPPPSREEIADYFVYHVNWLAGHQEHKPKGDIKQYCIYAIEELCKEQ